MLPDLSLGYFNTSMQGTGANNVFYSPSRRFNSAHIGIGIPLFTASQKAKVNASRLAEIMAEDSYQNQLNILETQYRSARSQYETYLQASNYFEQTTLPQAIIIAQTANKQFINGEINYLDWVMLNNQAIIIRSNYLDILKALNESIISINYLNSEQQ